MTYKEKFIEAAMQQLPAAYKDHDSRLHEARRLFSSWINSELADVTNDPSADVATALQYSY